MNFDAEIAQLASRIDIPSPEEVEQNITGNEFGLYIFSWIKFDEMCKFSDVTGKLRRDENWHNPFSIELMLMCYRVCLQSITVPLINVKKILG